MKNTATMCFLLVFCFGCNIVPVFQDVAERYGPGPDSAEFASALDAVVEQESEAVSSLATLYQDVHGFDNIRDLTDHGAAGVLVVTQDDVIFLAWDYFEYAPTESISRQDLTAVVVEAMGKNRRLVLVTENDVNTFELVRDDRLYVDVEGTEAIAALLSQTLGELPVSNKT